MSPRPDAGSAEPPNAEVLLTQALRAIAGAPKPVADLPSARRNRLTTAQLMLIAILVGLLAGVTAGLLSVLL